MNERQTLTPELIGILSVGIALAGLMAAIWLDLRADVRTLREENRRAEAELRDDMRENDRELRTVLRSDLNGVLENQRAAETQLTVIATTLGFIRDELQPESNPAPDNPQ